MTKYLAGILIAVAGALLSGTAPRGHTQDLWIGVISDAPPLDQRNPVAAFTVLEPVAALVADRWWFDTGNSANWDDNDRHLAIHNSVGDVPAKWLPLGTDLPSTWRARLFNGQRVSVHTSGPLHVSGVSDNLAVTTDLKLRPELYDSGPRGIAFAGDIELQLFTDLPEERWGELLRFLAPSMLRAERAAIIMQSSAGHPSDAEATLLSNRLTSAALTIQTARTATQRDGSVYLVEGGKQLGTDAGCTGMHTGAAARRDRAGALHVLGEWSYLVCNELHVDHKPLALLGRSGKICWLTEYIYEDGIEYVLSRPGQIDKEEPTCDIK